MHSVVKNMLIYIEAIETHIRLLHRLPKTNMLYI